MQLFIQDGDPGLYNLIQTTDLGVTCLLTGSLSECLTLFKQTIITTVAPSGIQYVYDDTTHLVVDYTQSPFKATDGSTFTNL